MIKRAIELASMWIQTWNVAVGRKYLTDTVFNWSDKLTAIDV